MVNMLKNWFVGLLAEAAFSKEIWRLIVWF